MTEFLIWSNEHQAWWKPNEAGYTTLTHEAGRYTRERANAICNAAGGISPEEERRRVTLMMHCAPEIVVVAPRGGWAQEQFEYARGERRGGIASHDFGEAD